MHHKASLTKGPFETKPFRIQCACGSAGDFNLKEQAEHWFSIHTSRIGPTETSELTVEGAGAPPPPPPPPVPFRGDNQQPKEENAT